MNNREIAEHCTNTIWKHISEGTYNDLIDAITQALDEKDRYKDEFCEALLEDKKSIVSILKAENTAIREERGDTLTDQLRQGWLCFHCGERFHTFGAAEDHFGATPESVAGCLIITSEDRGILMALRRTEAQVATLREALVKAEQFIDIGYIHLPDPGIGDTATDTPKAIREALAVLATSQGDTEGNILAGNEAEPSGPYNHASGCRAKPDEMPPCDCSYGPDDEYVRNQPDYYDRDKRQPTQKEEMPGISWAEYKPQPSDNDRVMDLIRAVKKWQEEWDCPPDGWHGASVATESALYTLAKSLPPHIIELARKGDW